MKGGEMPTKTSHANEQHGELSDLATEPYISLTTFKRDLASLFL